MPSSIINVSTLVSIIALGITIFQWCYNIKNKKKESVKAQASLVSAWIKEYLVEDITQPYSVVSLNNLSNMPVYNVVVTVVEIMNNNSYVKSGKDVRRKIKKNNYEESNGVILDILPPGKYKCKLPYISTGMQKRAGVEIAFRDSMNNFWVRSVDGHLSQINKDPYNYYDLFKPMSVGTIYEREN